MLIIYVLSQQKKLELIPNGMNAKVSRTWHDKGDKAILMNTQFPLLSIIQRTWNFKMTQNTCRQSLVNPVIRSDVMME